jgi:hypothetical protein
MVCIDSTCTQYTVLSNSLKHHLNWLRRVRPYILHLASIHATNPVSAAQHLRDLRGPDERLLRLILEVKRGQLPRSSRSAGFRKILRAKKSYFAEVPAQSYRVPVKKYLKASKTLGGHRPVSQQSRTIPNCALSLHDTTW